MTRLSALFVLALFCASRLTLATVGGPLVIEVLGVSPDSTRIYWTFHFQGETDELFPVFFYSTEKEKLQQRHGWSNYPNEDIEESFARYRRKFQLDTSNRSTDNSYQVVYKDSSYYNDTIHYLPYPIFSYYVYLPSDTIVVRNRSHKKYVPRIIRSYQLKDGVLAHVCRFMGIAMEGGYTKDTVIIDDRRSTTDTSASVKQDTSLLEIPFNKKKVDVELEQPHNTLAWVWWGILLAVVSTFLFIFLRNRRKKDD